MASIMASIWASAEESDLACCGFGASFLAATLLALYILCWRGQQDDDFDCLDQLFDDASDYAFSFFSSLTLALSFFAGLITYLAYGEAISAWAATHYNEQVFVIGIVLLSLLLVACMLAAETDKSSPVEVAMNCFLDCVVAPFAFASRVGKKPLTPMVSLDEIIELNSKNKSLEEDLVDEHHNTQEAELNAEALVGEHVQQMTAVSSQFASDLKALKNETDAIIEQHDNIHLQHLVNTNRQVKKLRRRHQCDISQKKSLVATLKSCRSSHQQERSKNAELENTSIAKDSKLEKLETECQELRTAKDDLEETWSGRYHKLEEQSRSDQNDSIAKDSKIEALESLNQKLQTAKDDLETTSSSRYSDLEQLYHCHRDANLFKDKGITDVKRQRKDLRSQKADLHKDWTRKHGELQEKYRAQGKGHGDLIHLIESLTQQRNDQEKYWIEKCGELEKQHKDDQDASLAKDSEIADLKLESDSQNKCWFNKHQAL
jgi:hypothetical protein